jgi:hypothetical protein
MTNDQPLHVIGAVFALLLSSGLVLVCQRLIADRDRAVARALEADDRAGRERARVQVLSQEARDARSLVTGRPHDPLSADQVTDALITPGQARLREVVEEGWIVEGDLSGLPADEARMLWQAISRARSEPPARNLNDAFFHVYEPLDAAVRLLAHLRLERARARDVLARASAHAEEDAQSLRSARAESDALRAEAAARLTSDLARFATEEEQALAVLGGTRGDFAVWHREATRRLALRRERVANLRERLATLEAEAAEEEAAIQARAAHEAAASRVEAARVHLGW